MTTTGTETSQEPRGDVTVTISSRAGRVLFALLLLPGASTLSLSLSTLANVPRKLLPACIDEVSNAVDAFENGAPERQVTEVLPQNYVPEPEDMAPLALDESVEAACMTADQTGDTRAQALAVVKAWELFFPEVNKVQELQPRKAKEWVKIVGSAFPGHAATTVFGWLGGVDEAKLLSLDFPLAYVNKMLVNRAEEAGDNPKQAASKGVVDEGVPAEWRQYAKKLVEQSKDPEGRGNNHVGKNIEGHLDRIAQAVQRSTGQP